MGLGDLTFLKEGKSLRLKIVEERQLEEPYIVVYLSLPVDKLVDLDRASALHRTQVFANP
jgi:hypothetical protein